MIMFNQPIVFVSENKNDFQTLSKGFAAVNFVNALIHCISCEDALDYLSGRGKYRFSARIMRPGIILVDTEAENGAAQNFPALIKQHREFRDIPVILIVPPETVPAGADSRRRRVTADCTMEKPVSFDGFVKSIQQLEHHSFEIVVLPNREPDRYMDTCSK